MYKLLLTNSFKKESAKFFKKHPELWSRYQEIIKILQADPYHPILRTHKLSGKLEGKWAISVTISYRLIVTFVIKEKIVVLIEIGDHDEVY